jgi:hypothetical protein
MKQSLLEIRLFHDFGKIPFIQITEEISRYKIWHETRMNKVIGKEREDEEANKVFLRKPGKSDIKVLLV